ncbi:MAG: Alpha-xylosidase [Myxococcaceae bacterium]|nr:Alpha-xylosidase [Myxococcaceae bacterium]
MRALFALLLLAACAPSPSGVLQLPQTGAVDEAPEPPRFTPRWAFLPWISKDISTGADSLQFVDGFISRDIPVGVLVIDSPWETSYNSYVPNEKRYPQFAQMVAGFRTQGVRTVTWITGMVNAQSFDGEPGGDVYSGASPNFGEAKVKGWFVNDGELSVWWKGQGAGIDFFNPEAVKFAHRQQDKLLALGISGWKLDFGEEYLERSKPLKTAAGPKTIPEYGQAYYRDFLAHGVMKKGRKEFLTMSRPWDESYGFPGRFYAKKEHCPVGWVGDNRRDWIGLIDALDHLFKSAQAGYVVIGSDIGGYLDVDDLDVTGPRIPFSQANFARWTAVGAMTPFMQLHGRGNFTPWTVPERVDETVELYRYWSKLHTALVPFFFSLAQDAYLNDAAPILRPVGDGPAAWKDDWRFGVGDAFLVAPILDDTGVRSVALPAGSRWVDWWDPLGAPLDGGQTLAAYDATDRRRIPLFVKVGSVLPLDVVDGVNGLGTPASKGRLTLLAYAGPQATRFKSFDDEGRNDLTVELKLGGLSLEHPAPIPAEPLAGVVVRLWTELPITSASARGQALTKAASRSALDTMADGWFAEPGSRYSWIRLGPVTGASTAVSWTP